ncbi:MAG: shikimate dehydrogenase [Cytophagaceae bacterium]|nr:shikimate dehydrogenase [Cytophagaceae bacterium]
MSLYGLIGYPLTHSFSKKYFTGKFEKERIDHAKYELFEIKDIQDFPSIIKNNPALKGLNVTIPHKEAVMQFLDELDEPVKKIKAVNVIKVMNGKLKGYNSDYHGFKTSLEKFLADGKTSEVYKHADETRKVFETLRVFEISALVLGTGGAAKAVKAVLEDLKINYKTVSRNKNQGDLTYDELKGQLKNFPLIINTSPVGMYPKTDACPDLPYEEITNSHYLFDLVYNPEETLFMKKGEEKGARTKNGLEMLHLQAEKAWAIWNA